MMLQRQFLPCLRCAQPYRNTSRDSGGTRHVTSQTASDFRPKFVATIFSSFVSSHPLFFFLPHIAMNHVRGFIINFYNIGDPSTILRLQPRSAIKISGYVPSLVKSGNRFGLTLTQLDHPVTQRTLPFSRLILGHWHTWKDPTVHMKAVAWNDGKPQRDRTVLFSVELDPMVATTLDKIWLFFISQLHV